MAYCVASAVLYKNLQEGVGTDCSFVFKNINTETDGSESTKVKVIHAHRCVLSAVCPYFETNLKSTWKGDEPIEVTTVEYSVFQDILKAIYLCEMDPVKNLKYGLDFYEAAHFYQLEAASDLVRNELIKFCRGNEKQELSQLIKTALKYQDYRLIEFIRKHFTSKAGLLISEPDFLNYPPESINMLYQIDELNAYEGNLFKALENYVDINGPTYITLLKPAIKAIRFGALFPYFKDTILLSEEEKNILQKTQAISFSHLSKNVEGRIYKR